MKKGFTLIEILAVIVILAIILLIATPIINNVIESVKRDAFFSSVKILAKKAEEEFTIRNLKDGIANLNYQFEDNDQIGTDKVAFSGKSPKEGFINVRPDGKIEVSLSDGVFCVTKTFEEETINIRKLANGESCIPTTEFAMSNCKFENSSTHLSSVPSGYTGIYNIADLLSINSNLRNNYILMNDLDLSSYPDWTPIGDTLNSIWFEGVFNGNGYSISNMNIISNGSSLKGLFAATSNSEFKNLNLKNFNIVGTTSNSGGLIGISYGTILIDNVSSSGTVNTGLEIGGLIGQTRSATVVTQSCSDISVRGDSSTYLHSYGGLIGRTLSLTYVGNSYSLVDIDIESSSSMDIGGLIGDTLGTVTIESSYTEGQINGAKGRTGGLLGEGIIANMKNSYSTVDMYATVDSVGSGGYIGGLVGIKNTEPATISTIENCYYEGTISIIDSTSIGGLFGAAQSTRLVNSYAKANLTSNDRVGGIIGTGHNSNPQEILAFDKVFFEGNITGVETLGGLFGYMGLPDLVVTDAYSISNITGENKIGSIAGFVNTKIEVNNFYHFGTITGTTNTYSMIGETSGTGSSTVLNNSFWNSELSGINTPQFGSIALSNSDFSNPSTFTNWNFANTWDVFSGSPRFKNFNETTPWSSEGNSPVIAYKPLPFFNKNSEVSTNNCTQVGTAITATVPGGYVGIYTPEDLDNIRNNLSGNYILMSDLNLENYISWEPIGTKNHPFTGQFDGNGFNICNTNFNSDYNIENLGIFGGIKNSTISNVKIQNSKFNFNILESGTLFGNALNATINNVSYVDDGTKTYKKMSNYGLIGGKAVSSTLTGMTVNTNINSNSISVQVGGIIGQIETGTLQTATFTGDINLPNSTKVGGITGSSINSTLNSLNTIGDIAAKQSTGGTAGFTNLGGTITGATYSGNITASSYVGGIVGEVFQNLVINNSSTSGTAIVSDFAVGGIVGSGFRTKINSSSSTMNVTGVTAVGGLVGNLGGGSAHNTATTCQIQNSYSTGNVFGSTRVGGIIGSLDGGILFTKSNFKGTVQSTTTDVGGLIGKATSTSYIPRIINSYANASVIGQSNVGGLVGIISGSPIITYQFMYNYFTGTITGNTTVGGLIGASTYTSVSSSYWNTTTSGIATSAGGTARNTTQLQTQSNFTSWNFTTDWIMSGYPRLRWE